MFLFAIVADTRAMTPPQRQQVRAEQSRPLLAQIEAMLLQHGQRVRDIGHMTDYASYRFGEMYLRRFGNPLKITQ
ncbi:hypothetical protein ACIQVE_22335 [Pseudomonas sp. NPDC098747]|uniref:hypothetical protein n=1 Tax=Pseudomonas sp. NPDC098747 TaxID=3364487 RepID=UPI00383A2C68